MHKDDQIRRPHGKAPPGCWWEERWFGWLLVALAAVPLLYPPVPPLVDLFGHMGRYRVQLDLASSPWLKDYYGFHWAAIGNLGVDLLLMPLAPLIGLEPAVKLIVLLIPPLTVAGFLAVAREVHKRLPPTVLFALPFAFAHPFMFGFVNYALSMAMALLAFALWLRLEEQGRLWLRAALFVPISLIVFFTHTFGWGVLGLLCFSGEAVRRHDRGRGWFMSGVTAAMQAAILALPALIMLLWRSEAHGGMTRFWFDWDAKGRWLKYALRDRWEYWDLASVGIVGLLLLAALISLVFRGRLTFSRNLLFSALVLLACFIIMPLTVFGSTYADMRLLPFVLALAVLAVRFRGECPMPAARLLAALGLCFYLLRLGGHTVSLAMAAEDQRAKLEALDHVPMGARVASLVGYAKCGKAWPLPRNTHLGAMTIVRRHGFSNDQWVIEGINLLDLRYRQAGPFAADSSQIVRGNDCGRRGAWRIDAALRALPRDRFDYVWMIDVPPFDRRLIAGMRPVWRGRGSILYQIRP